MGLRGLTDGARGQAALEYLMTYGWAILVIMIVGAYLWQMGIFGQQSIVPGCSGFSQIRPLDARFIQSSETLSMIIINEAGTTYEYTGMSATIGSNDCTCDPADGCDLADIGSVRPGMTHMINLTSCGGSYARGEYYKANIRISYENVVSGIEHVTTGDCWGGVE
jgi:hypothetical protein